MGCVLNANSIRLNPYEPFCKTKPILCQSHSQISIFHNPELVSRIEKQSPFTFCQYIRSCKKGTNRRQGQRLAGDNQLKSGLSRPCLAKVRFVPPITLFSALTSSLILIILFPSQIAELKSVFLGMMRRKPTLPRRRFIRCTTLRLSYARDICLTCRQTL